MSETKQKRRDTKARHERYRKAAARLTGLKVRDLVTVHESDDGAFVEVIAWIPAEEAEKETNE